MLSGVISVTAHAAKFKGREVAYLLDSPYSKQADITDSFCPRLGDLRGSRIKK